MQPHFVLIFHESACAARAMGKVGSKVLREASVDGIQAQVNAVCACACVCVLIPVKEASCCAFQLSQVMQPGSAMACFHTFITYSHFPTLQHHHHHHTSNHQNTLVSFGQAINTWWLHRVKQWWSLDVPNTDSINYDSTICFAFKSYSILIICGWNPLHIWCRVKTVILGCGTSWTLKLFS